MEEKAGFRTKIWNFFEHITRVVLEALLSVFKIKVSDQKWDAFMQFVKFGLVGVLNTFISYVVYLLFLIGLGEEFYILGNIVGFFVSVLNSFYWNDKYVFKKKEGENRSKLKALIKVILSYATTGLILSNVLLIVFVNVLQVPKTICPLVILLITIPLNYIMNKVWAFKDGK